MKYYQLLVKKKGKKTIIEVQGKKHSVRDVQLIIGVDGEIIRMNTNFKRGVAEIDYTLKGSLNGVIIFHDSVGEAYISEKVENVKEYSELISKLVQTYSLIESGQALSVDALHEFNLNSIRLLANALGVKIDVNGTDIVSLLEAMYSGLHQVPPVHEIQLSKIIIEERLRAIGVEEYKQAGNFFLVKFKDRLMIYGDIEEESIDDLIAVLNMTLNPVKYEPAPEIPVNEEPVEITIEQEPKQPATPEEFVEAVEDIMNDIPIE